MPVDLSEVGEPYPYPSHGPRLLPWLGIWFACCAVGVPLILLAWPASEPASGVGFWAAVIGGPQVVFLALLCIGRVSYAAPPVADINDNPTSDASADACGERLKSCKLRFGNGCLRFGGIPGAGQYR
ncbi:hypothetical protein [Caballeronia sp. Lep1P3]|uniref:hypothetical protein n=1 Tax=Caballeronia sp. Lep1P3 TaxID=2878150 RepID=UPI001FD01BBD|nr:hypothetical protein [Caballeronia sp. Lep1P3]